MTYGGAVHVPDYVYEVGKQSRHLSLNALFGVCAELVQFRIEAPLAIAMSLSIDVLEVHTYSAADDP